MSTDIVSDRPTSKPRSYRWRVVDIVVASVLAVAAGLVFVLWNVASNPIAAPLGAALPGLQARHAAASSSTARPIWRTNCRR